MPRYKNKFKSAVFHEETILGENDEVLGRLRIKPSGVSWKPAFDSAYYSVPLDKFVQWITADRTGANRTSN